MINQSLRWHSMPLIDEQTTYETEYLKRGASALGDEEDSRPPCPSQARSLEDMLKSPSSFPALILPTAVVKRSSLCICEAEMPTRVIVKSNGIEFQEVTLRSLNGRSLGINIEVKTRNNRKSVHHEFYIKQIHQKGNAYLDGRLKVGDRMIKVDDMIVGNANLAQCCQKQVWTLTIARRVEKEKMKFSCVQKSKTLRDTRSEDFQQLLCSRFLEGLDKKKVFREVKRAKKKHLWDNISTTCIDFEDLLIRSPDYIDRMKSCRQNDVNKNDSPSKQLQIFYPQQELFAVKSNSESSQQTIHHSPIPISSTSDL